MAQNLVIGGVTYNGVESLEMTNDSGEKVLYTEGGSGGDAEVLIIECLNPEETLDGNTLTITGTPSIEFHEAAFLLYEGTFGALKVTLEGQAPLYLPFVTMSEDYILHFATADGNGGTAVGEFHYPVDDGPGTITITIKAGDGDEGGDSEEEIAALLMNTLTTLDNSIATSLRVRACQGATKLVTVNLPSVTSLGNYAFYQCTGLVTVVLPKLTTVATQVFYSCTKLEYADCGNLSNIPAQTFNACSALTALILRKTSSICTLSNVNGVSNTPIGKSNGYVYVPSALMESYRAATNWSTYADRFRALEDYTVDGTVTGELDENKI